LTYRLLDFLKKRSLLYRDCLIWTKPHALQTTSALRKEDGGNNPVFG
jgi:hypothetical protein